MEWTRRRGRQRKTWWKQSRPRGFIHWPVVVDVANNITTNVVILFFFFDPSIAGWSLLRIGLQLGRGQYNRTRRRAMISVAMIPTPIHGTLMIGSTGKLNGLGG